MGVYYVYWESRQKSWNEVPVDRNLKLMEIGRNNAMHRYNEEVEFDLQLLGVTYPP